ncbi:hypothetical protein ABZX85_44170 [Streptomyces sp. NPDC004539]|uniref:hypothetical protein n=1 Tax=Streptomyces sp. NPDC004539 TaxID=3154280 RepID=UPI0033A8F2F4
MPKPRPALLAAPLAALALTTACNPALQQTPADAKPAPALAAAPFEKALGAEWKLTYRDMPGTERRMGSGEGRNGLRVGVVETKPSADTRTPSTSLAPLTSLDSLACQAFGKDVKEATRFLLACAEAATSGTAKDVRTWLTTHIDRPSTGPGHTTTHSTPHGTLDYHLGVNPTQAVRVLYISTPHSN